MTKPRTTALCLLGILLIAAVLRIAGCFGHGYPNSYYQDEQFSVQQALRFGAEGTLDPDWFNKPALGYYVLFAEYGGYYVLGRGLGFIESRDAFAMRAFNDPSIFYLIGRLSTAIFGILTVFLTYRLGRVSFGRTAGLFAALCLALMSAHIRSSQEVKMDVPSAFFTVWSAIYIVRLGRAGRLKHYLLAGALAGLGTATKYYSVALFVPYLYAHFFRTPATLVPAGKLLDRRVLAGMGAWLVAFFVGSPYNFLNPKFFNETLLPKIRFMKEQLGLDWLPIGAFQTPIGLRNDQESTLIPAIKVIFAMHWSTAVAGGILSIAAFVGVFICMRRHARRGGALVLSIAMLVGILAAMSQQWAESRHVAPLLPFTATLAGLTFATAFSWMRRILPLRGKWLALLVPLVLAAPFPHGPLYDAIQLDVHALTPDPRNEATRFIEERLPPDAMIINDHDRFPLKPSVARCEWALERVRVLRERSGIRDGWGAAYELKWNLRKRAAEEGKRRYFDVLALAHPWRARTMNRRVEVHGANDPIPPRSPWGQVWDQLTYLTRSEKRELTPRQAVEQFDLLIRKENSGGKVSPVEFWTKSNPPTRVAQKYLLFEEVNGKRVYRAAQFFITARISFDNYDFNPKRPDNHREFPDFAAFYEDLKSHYDYWEWGDPEGPPAEFVRLYDLRHRVTDRAPRRKSVDNP